jgi:DNA-binding response OmpR family regulator
VEARTGMKKKIVVVEDDKDLLLLLKTNLKNAGYEVTDFETGSPIVNNPTLSSYRF